MTGIQGVSSSLWLPISQSTSGKRPRSEGTTESNGGKEDNDKDIDEENDEDKDKDNKKKFLRQKMRTIRIICRKMTKGMMTITLRKKVNDVNDEESYEKVNRKTLTRTTAMEEVIMTMKRNIFC